MSYYWPICTDLSRIGSLIKLRYALSSNLDIIVENVIQLVNIYHRWSHHNITILRIMINLLQHILTKIFYEILVAPFLPVTTNEKTSVVAVQIIFKSKGFNSICDFTLGILFIPGKSGLLARKSKSKVFQIIVQSCHYYFYPYSGQYYFVFVLIF